MADRNLDINRRLAMLLRRVRRSVTRTGSASYSARLAALAGFTVRHKAAVIGAWLAVATLLTLLVPPLETVARRQSVTLIPGDVGSFQVVDRMGAAFDEQGSQTMLLVAMEDADGLGAAARQRYERLVSALRADTDHVRLVQDLLTDPVTQTRAISEDRQAWYLTVGVAGTLGDPTAAESIQKVRDITAEVFSGSSVTARVTGPPATFLDQIATAAHDLRLISVVIATLIALILLAVYRSVVTALLPLLAIGVSLVVGRGVLSLLGGAGMPVSQLSIGLMTTIMFGAGTDYAVFLISRYHERRRAQVPAEQAVVDAAATIGRVIVASAGTVAFAFLVMVSARLRAFAGIGPACAVAVFVALLATLTLLPPALTLAAGRGFCEPKTDRTLRYWNSVAVAVVRRPVALLSAGMITLLALTAVAATMRISYDDRKGQPANTASNQGYQLLDRHFGKDTTIPQFILVENPVDMRTGRTLADLDEMASRIAQLPGVTKVSGVTRPDGVRLESAQLSWQNGEIGDKLAGAVADGNARRDDLGKLTDGIDQLADGLTRLETTVRFALTPVVDLLTRSQSGDTLLQSSLPSLQQLSEKADNIDGAIQAGPGLRSFAEQAQTAIFKLDPAARSLKTALWCAVMPQCDQIRDQVQILVSLRDTGFFNQVADLGDRYNPDTGATVAGALTDVQRVVAGLRKAFGGSGDPAGAAGSLRGLQDGIGQLAAAARTLARGVHALIDDNIDLLSRMGQLAAQLQNSAKASVGSDAASGFYLPAEAFANRKFVDVAKQFLAPDGRTARFVIESSVDPYSGVAMDLSARIAAVADAARPNTSLAEATVSAGGFPAVNSDIQRLLRADFIQLALATLLIIGLILVVLLRAVLAPLYLLGTVVLNYLASLGIGVVILQWGFGREITWPVPLLALIILVAVGADYNMLLVSRLREESGGNIRVAVLRTVARTGSVITSAGLIFAASMFGLLIGSVQIMVQTGLVIGCGLLLDTFVVRTLIVPAIATLLREKSWWPSAPVRVRAGALPAMELDDAATEQLSLFDLADVGAEAAPGDGAVMAEVGPVQEVTAMDVAEIMDEAGEVAAAWAEAAGRAQADALEFSV